MYGKKALYPVLAAAFVMLAAVGLAIAVQTGSFLDKIHFYDAVYHIELSLFYDEAEDTYYLFLPSYSALEDISVEHGNVEVSFEADGVSCGDSLAALPLEKDIVMQISNGKNKTEQYTLQLWHCQNLPTIYIETQSGTLDNVNRDKSVEEDAAVLIVDAEGSLLYEGTGTLSGHGNGTWGKAKNPYNLTFPEEINVIGFEQLKNLCLFAEYSDESKMHNSISYYMGAKLEIPYASQYTYVDVYANGEYLGMYGAATKKEYMKYIDTDDIQAVFEVASTGDVNSFTSDLGWCIQVMYGDLNTIKQTVQRFESALEKQDFEQCEQLIDIQSFAAKYALEEFVANYDLQWNSKYFYIDNVGIVHCMLPWDYDWGFGYYTTYFNDFVTNSIMAYIKGSEIRQYSWFVLLLKDDAFIAQVSDILSSQYTENFLADVRTYIRETADRIQYSRECDYIRYKNENPYTENDISSGIDTLDGFVEYFNTYLTERKNFLTAYFSNIENYHLIEFWSNKAYGNLCIPYGASLTDYLNEDSNILNLTSDEVKLADGWKTEDGLEPLDVSVITKDIVFYGQTADSANLITKIITKIQKRFFELSAIGGFGLVLLLFIIWELSNGRLHQKRMREKAYE